VERADDVVAELVVAGHALRLRLGELHQLGIDGHRREAVVLPIAGDHRCGGRGVDLRARGRHAAIEARIFGGDVAVAQAAGQQRGRSHGSQARAAFSKRSMQAHGPQTL
jgi:hypothetical protein